MKIADDAPLDRNFEGHRVDNTSIFGGMQPGCLRTGYVLRHHFKGSDE